ncbi:MAG TPA: NrfD/PsrC family molybdoenzyme membrane anchor subunit [Candidatus Methylomirabilis sp.]|nr:NrfD/PsrC family molybdoenzyme membrane anchor subunit [Candidatus Methylomirabilis sp.]HSC71235.1 NrfD/PsrC family molybdoenzyme membrane anchor subunit [Candidatus Methylomirabilis sp.]
MPNLTSPHWPLLIDIYFFLVGVAGGAFMAAGVADIFGGKKDRVVTKVGSWLALLALIPGPIFLIIDLGMPSRFLNMMFSSKTSTSIGLSAITIGPFHIKPFSPMNLGAWALMGFGLCALGVVVALYLEDNRRARNLAPLRGAFGAIGVLLGFFVAGYPGQLLAATAQPFWTNARPLGALFMAVGAATGLASIALILSLQGPEVSSSLVKVRRAYTITVVLEALTLIAVLWAVSQGPAWSAGRLWMLFAGRYSPIFWIGAVAIGLVLPLVLEFRDGFLQNYRQGPGRVVLASALILVGGFLIKYVIFAVGQA